MSAAECASESNTLAMDAEPSTGQPSLAEKSRKRLFVSFAGTVAIGLALAAWYVGDRIYAADTTQPAPLPAITFEALANIPSPTPPPVAYVIPVRAPQPPELYLQTASLGDKQDLRFVKQLESKGYRARIDGSDRDAEGRILIGPYTERVTLERARRKLAAAGILAAESSH